MRVAPGDHIIANRGRCWRRGAEVKFWWASHSIVETWWSRRICGLPTLL